MMTYSVSVIHALLFVFKCLQQKRLKGSDWLISFTSEAKADCTSGGMGNIQVSFERGSRAEVLWPEQHAPNQAEI